VILVFSVGLSLGASAGLMGIPLAFILSSWFFKYAYILFDNTVQGSNEPPTLDIQMMNPVDELRPVAQVIILGLIIFALYWVQNKVGAYLTVPLAITTALLLPASIAILGLEGNPLKAINPMAWLQLIRGLGMTYAAILAVIAGYSLTFAALSRWHLWLPLQLGIELFIFLSTFTLIAGALYTRRHELGLETWHSPERNAERQRTADQKLDDQFITEAYGKIRVGAHTQAWTLLNTWLTAHHHAPESYQWLCERVAIWPDPRYITRLTEDYIDQLLTQKRNGPLLDVMDQRLNVDPNFRPKSANSTLQIAQLASRGGMPRIARILLSDFASRYAGDPSVAVAQSLARTHALTLPDP